MDYYLRYLNLKQEIQDYHDLPSKNIQFRKQIAVEEMYIEYDNYLSLEEKLTWHQKYDDLLELLNN
jgi:hypothetical protein